MINEIMDKKQQETTATKRPFEIPSELPKDLEFVYTDLDMEQKRGYLGLMAKQWKPRTEFQKQIENIPLSGKQIKEYLPEYGITEKDLFAAFEKLEQKTKQMGIDVEYVDMSGFSEDVYYGNEFEDPEHRIHAETARSNGKTLFLEKDLEKAGNIPGRMYDLMHLSFGHMVQWSTDDPKALLTKDQAWSVGYRNHDESPDRVLELVQLYEFEAGLMGINMLQKELKNVDLPDQTKEGILQYFTDYVYTDGKFITGHYRGNKDSFESHFKPGQDIPSEFEEYTLSNLIERETMELGLIKDQQK